MLVLLPPSEGKAVPARAGRPLDPAALSAPELSPARAAVLDALVELSAGEPDLARAALGLSPGQDDELRRNARLRTAATLRVDRLYSGVLYDALSLATLPAPARRLAGRSLLIFSALWGVLRTTDRVPPYRCSAGARLPGVGPLGAYWRRELTATLPAAAGRRLVLDLRSTGYASMWQPTGELADRTVAVRVLHEQRVGGELRRSVVSHFNKATKGRLVRDLLIAGVRPRTPDELVTALRDLSYTVEAPDPAPGRPRRLDLVVTQL
ncbi:peroxide stress protein YaaA [Plantactinospora siamensis]|uniref:Peroxide stress protein YaaA n=1 Tax=Plantactinospora siamensis TaxID=555372 RepID=A0ABV6P2J9_9ACTN